MNLLYGAVLIVGSAILGFEAGENHSSPELTRAKADVAFYKKSTYEYREYAERAATVAEKLLDRVSKCEEER